MAKKTKEKPSVFSRICSKLLVLVVLVLIFLIVLKSNVEFRNFVYKNVFQNNLSFAKINETYKKYFGSSLPLEQPQNVELVSANKLEYTESSKYNDGVKLTVQENYLVPSMDSGLIIFIGEKENYGNTVIVQRPDNVEVWYCNIKTVSVSLYDYIKKGQNIGEVNGTNMYMAFAKEGKFLDYNEYI